MRKSASMIKCSNGIWLVTQETMMRVFGNITEDIFINSPLSKS